MRISSFIVGVLVVVVAAIAGCKPLDRATYENCVFSSDCIRAGDSCEPVPNLAATNIDRMCTHSCSTGLDCPTSRNGASGVCMCDSFCYSACDVNNDCPAGWTCAVTPCRPNAVCIPR